MLKQTHNINLHIGVKNLSFALGKCLLKLSFELEGNFSAAAKSDCLQDTVDYDALSKHLENQLKALNCQQNNKIRAGIATALSNFSPLISNYYLETEILCDEGCHDLNTRL